MCGVLGYYSEKPSSRDFLDLGRLLWQSKIRGLHAFGIAWLDWSSDSVQHFRFHRLEQVLETIAQLRKENRLNPACLILHTRYCQSGDWRILENNQPVVVGDFALAFNGVISMATKPEFESEFGVKCIADNDGEIFIRKVLAGEDPGAFVAGIRGSFAGAYLWGRKVWALRNARRPLYWYRREGSVFVTSTRDIFERALSVGDLAMPFAENQAMELQGLL